ncbi:MAG TPA: alpha/beta fold hydrolase [Pseudomonadales bacterium]|nr:alpha/beta fold hydrolase [Pseudomonadales bacterium]
MISTNRSEHLLKLAGPSGALEAILTSAGPNPHPITAIVCHPHSLMGGTMNNKVVHTVSRALRELGVQNLRFNFRGVGQSEGEYDEGVGETEDLFAVIDWVKKNYADHRLWLAGFSFGSFVAARASTLSAERGHEIEQLLLIAPPVMRGYHFETLPHFPCPVTVLMGDADEVVPAEQVYQWFDTLPQPARLVKFPDTSHFFHGKLTDLKENINRLYAERV